MSYQVPTYAVPEIYTDKAKSLYTYLNQTVSTTVGGTRQVTVIQGAPANSSASSFGWISSIFSRGIFIDASTRNIGIFNSSTRYITRTTSSADSEDAEANTKKVKKEENNKAALIVAGLAFTVLGGVYSYFLGKAIAQKEDAETDLIQVEELKLIAERCQQSANFLDPNDSHSFNTQMQQVNTLIEASKSVFVFKRSEALTDIALNTSLIGIAIIGAVGSVMAWGSLIGLGAAGGLAIVTAKLIKLGLNGANSKRMALHAQAVEETTTALLKVAGQVQNPKGDSPVVMVPPYSPAVSAPGFFD